jgi:hypothetical protein
MENKYADKPSKLKLYQLRVDRLDASTKFEGRWVLNGVLIGASAANEVTPVKLWMSHKQAQSVHKNMDAKELYAVLDVIDAEKPRFVWASNNRVWLAQAFLKNAEAALSNPAQDFHATEQATVARQMTGKGEFSKAPTYVQAPTRFETGEEELPF